MKLPIITLTLLALFLMLGCSPQKSQQPLNEKTQMEDDIMKLTSPAFQESKLIPSKYTCDGQDISPELHISDVPAAAKSLALIMDDPDAPMGTFVHWVAWNIPTTTKIIEEGAKLTNEGISDFKRSGYGGPCPPSGTHRYYFKLYALDTTLTLPSSTQKKDLEKAMQGHTLAQVQLMGTYTRD